MGVKPPAKSVARIGAGFAAAAALACAGLASAQPPPGSSKGGDLYAAKCSGCHGPELTGGAGSSLIAQTYVHGTGDAEVARSIRDGYPAKGMPAWGPSLSKDDIDELVAFIQSQREAMAPERLKAQDKAQERAFPKTVRTEREAVRVDRVAVIGQPWGMAVLPDRRLLVTDDVGLRMIDPSRASVGLVKGTPSGHPIDLFKHVLIDVAIHPDYARNGWIYLTCGDSGPGPDGKPVNQLKIVRGRLRGEAWVDSETLVTLPLDTTTGRMAFDGKGHLYLTTTSNPGITESTDVQPYTLKQLSSMPPQNLLSYDGKILRFTDDGRIPADNPFVGRTDALAAIWSYGHRNPQGLTVDPKTGWVWSSEHGPRGGDELNLIRRGRNYGFPVISYGTKYDGMTFTTEIAREGMEQPVINWTPSIAVSGIAFYEGNAFPAWRGDLLVGSLKQQELRRVRLDGDFATLQETLLKNIGRIRAIAVGRAGEIYLAIQLKTEGMVLRLSPAGSKDAAATYRSGRTR